MRGAAVLLALVLLAGCASPTSPSAISSPSPAAGHDRAGGGLSLPLAHGVAVSDGAEPSILADKLGRYLWIGDSSGTSVSADNGTTWSSMSYTGNLGAAFGDGVALAQDDAGRLYAAYLHDNRIDVARSDDGHSFNDQALAAGVSDSVDRPWIGAYGEGEVALFYVDAVGVLIVSGTAHCARSTDAGQTFSDRRPLAADPQGGKAFYDASGDFYYAQDDGAVTRFTDSCLAGGSAVQMLSDVDGPNNMIQADAWGDDVYMAAADSSGRIVLAGNHGGNGVGKTLVVSPSGMGMATYATVSPWRDEVAVAWYGSPTAGDPFSSSYRGEVSVYAARVQGFWSEHPSITQVNVTGVMHHGYICAGGVACTSGRDLLDYFMIDHDVWGGLHVAYVDDTGSAGVRYVHLLPLGAAPPAPEPVPEANTTAAPTSTRSPSASSSTSKSHAPTPTGPTPRFEGTVRGLTVQVDGRSSTGKAPLTYRWSWGDGTASIGSVSRHTYADPGSYELRLRVTDASGRAAERASIVHAVEGGGSDVGGGGDGGTVTIQVPGLPAEVLLGILAVAALAARRSRRT